MPLASILDDPNYVNANAETKQAIFDKVSAQDTNFTQANSATQAAIRSKYGVASAPAPAPVSEGMPTERQIPAWGKESPNLYAGAQSLRDVAGIVLPTAGAIGGGAAGTLGGPVGAVLGAGTGYAAGEALVHPLDVALGNIPADTSIGQGIERGVKDIALGSTMEAAGPYVIKGLGKAYDLLSRQLGNVKAAQLLKDAFGSELSAGKQAAANAPAGATAAQAISETQNPTAQALIERLKGRTPTTAANQLTTAQAQEAARVNKLTQLAEGATQTEARTAQIEAKEALNKRLIPELKIELNAANTANKMLPKFENDMQRNAYMAATKAEEAKFGAGAAGKASSGEELKALAAKQAADAEAGQLTFEEAGRFAKQAADSLAAHGLNPLKSKDIIANINKVITQPKFAGNREVNTALSRVAEDIKNSTSAGGVIDADALDAIRKNSVNGAVQFLLSNASPTAQKALAAKLTAQIRPLIIDAMEAAGGTGYRAYLENYAKGSQAIAQKKMSAKALEMYSKDPQSFVELVKGNSQKEVEKIFGPGSYDIAKEMSEAAMKTLKGVAGEVTQSATIKAQAAAGMKAYEELLSANTNKLRIPFFGPKITAANAVIDQLESRLGKKTMDILTNAVQSGKSLDALLKVAPATERNFILRELSKPEIRRAASFGSAGALEADTRKNNLGR